MLATNGHVLSWLERHAAAVQALASIATVFITMALAWITRKYVLLTQEMAITAREQLRVQHHTERTDAAQLLTLIEVFLGYLKRLPMRDEDGEPLRDVSLWRHTDIRKFAALAAAVLGAAAIVHDAIQALNAIRARVDRVRQASAGHSKRLMFHRICGVRNWRGHGLRYVPFVTPQNLPKRVSPSGWSR